MVLMIMFPVMDVKIVSRSATLATIAGSDHYCLVGFGGNSHYAVDPIKTLFVALFHEAYRKALAVDEVSNVLVDEKLAA